MHISLLTLSCLQGSGSGIPASQSSGSGVGESWTCHPSALHAAACEDWFALIHNLQCPEILKMGLGRFATISLHWPDAVLGRISKPAWLTVYLWSQM